MSRIKEQEEELIHWSKPTAVQIWEPKKRHFAITTTQFQKRKIFPKKKIFYVTYKRDKKNEKNEKNEKNVKIEETLNQWNMKSDWKKYHRNLDDM